ncbi:MAG TPA: AI-2E family transporter [Stellaceae bacterium]|nr:AI-2E family transporter [Stellaceae bacterium]
MTSERYAGEDTDAPHDKSPATTRYAMMLPATSREEGLAFVVRAALAVAAVFVGLYVVWMVHEAFLLLLLAIVFATVLIAAIEPVQRLTPLSHRWALAMVAVALFVVTAAVVWLMGSQIIGQISTLAKQLPAAVESIEESLGLSVESVVKGEGNGQALGGLLGSFLSFGTTILGALGGLVLAVIGAFFLAADPETYLKGTVKLFPKQHHEQMDDALRASGRALKLWLLAQFVSMTVIGILVWLGAWIIGLPAPLALGIFAGMAAFIPYLGPFIGAAPAVLLALSEGGTMVLWVILMFVTIEQIESNLIQPLVQQEMVEIPAALTLFAVVAVGLLFGTVGLIVAAPLTVVTYVLVTKLYVRDTLGVPAEVPGENR